MPAIIDIGSNSVILLIAEKTKSGWKTVYEDTFTTRFIETGGERRTIDTLFDCLNICKKHKECDINIIGTASFRSPKGKLFVNFLNRILPAQIKTLSSIDEANLAFEGAVKEFKYPLISVDIGGGSTDVVIVSSNKKRKFYSFENLGAIRLKNMLNSTDKLSLPEIKKMFCYINSQFSKSSLPKKIKSDCKIIASGGTATTLASIDLCLPVYNAEIIHAHKISIDKLKSIFYLMCSKSLPARKKITGLSSSRADIIIFGTAILIALMEKTEAKYFTVNHKGIRWGYLQKLFGKNSGSRLSTKRIKRKGN